jgi:hypothetical protein
MLTACIAATTRLMTPYGYSVIGMGQCNRRSTGQALAQAVHGSPKK